MTPDELTELDRWLAVNCMGWELVTYKPQPYEKRDGNGIVERYEDGSPVICYYHQEPMWRDGKGRLHDPKLWSPTRNLLQAEIIIKKMHELGFNYNFNWQGHEGIYTSIAQFHKFDLGYLEHGQGSVDIRETEHVMSLPTCLAAKAALEAEKGER